MKGMKFIDGVQKPARKTNQPNEAAPREAASIMCGDPQHLTITPGELTRHSEWYIREVRTLWFAVDGVAAPQFPVVPS